MNKEDHKTITGWPTPEEYLAYEEGRRDEQEVMMDFIKKWDGYTNSSFGIAMSKKFNELYKESMIEFAQFLVQEETPDDMTSISKETAEYFLNRFKEKK
jgi:hypothetical protein